MRTWLNRVATVLALGFVALTCINASWLAPTPQGYIDLIALHGLAQQPAQANAGGNCAAGRIETPVHDFVANTLPSLADAGWKGAQLIEVDLAPTQDGKIVLFGDDRLDCLTDGKGTTRDHTLAQLKALDAGYGYSPDEGKTHPFRGKLQGGIPSLEEALDRAGRPLLYSFSGTDQAEAQMLTTALKAAGRDVEAKKDAFIGSPEQIANIRKAYPKAWAWSLAEAEACTRDYMRMGWIGLTPESCRNGTLIVPLDRKWAFAGWPDRLIDRMQAVGARIIVAASKEDGKWPVGLDLPEQLGEIPNTFTGYVWTADIWTIGAALRPALNRRTDYQEQLQEKVLEQRRIARAKS